MENIIDTSVRKVTQKPRKTDATRSSDKTETQEKELDYIKNTSSLIKSIRLAKEYTQPDVAKKSGLRQQMISRIDRNDINPRLSTVKKYLEACDIDLDKLLEEALNNISQ